MGMFDSYNNLNDNYIPNNIEPRCCQTKILDSSIPKIIYNLNNEFVGYQWHSGDIFDLILSVNKKILVSESSLILDNQGEIPNVLLPGKFIGQKAYNIVDCKSWTLMSIIDDGYIWEEDKLFTYCDDGDKEIELRPDMTDKYIEFNLYDFRYDKIYSQVSDVGESSLIINTDKPEFQKPGIFNGGLYIIEDNIKKLYLKFNLIIEGPHNYRKVE